MRPLHRMLPVGAGVLSAALLAACSSGTLTSAGTLSKAGQTAAGAAGQAAVASGDQYAAYKDTEIYLHGFAGTPSEDPALIAVEDKNEAELTSRAQLFASLAKAYASLGNLAGYDASTEFQGDIQTLFSNINAYQKAVKQPQVNAKATELVPPAAGALVGLVQGQMVITASNQIRQQVVNVIAIMSDPQVRAQFVGTKTYIVNELALNAETLMQRGLLSPKSYFTAMGQPLGMDVSDDFAARLKTDKFATQGINALVASKVREQVALVGSSYDSSLAALKALLPLHDKLAAGTPLDLTQIDQIVQQIQTIAAGIAPPSTGAGK